MSVPSDDYEPVNLVLTQTKIKMPLLDFDTRPEEPHTTVIPVQITEITDEDQTNSTIVSPMNLPANHLSSIFAGLPTG